MADPNARPVRHRLQRRQGRSRRPLLGRHVGHEGALAARHPLSLRRGGPRDGRRTAGSSSATVPPSVPRVTFSTSAIPPADGCSPTISIAEPAHSQSRVFWSSLAETDGMPDGLCVDSAGAVYCAHYGGGRITRFRRKRRTARSSPSPRTQRDQLLSGRPRPRHSLCDDCRRRRDERTRWRLVRKKGRRPRPARAALRLSPLNKRRIARAQTMSRHA